MSTVYKNIGISIIIPLYRGAKYCTRLLEMIETNCLYKDLFEECNIEVIFVNDFPDERIIIEKKYSVFDVKIIEQERNQGIQASRVKGIINSKGEFIIMLDQDDLVTENWLYSQWHKVISKKSAYCVCNGWKGRFSVLWGDNDIQDRINNLAYYLSEGNAICSPGQVIIKKKCLPEEWLNNIQTCNGADDFFLWIIVLKKGNKFLINNECLYYHTPERNKNSISSAGMVNSLRETIQILSSIGILEESEVRILDRRVIWMEYLEQRRKIEESEKISIMCRREIGKYYKFRKMFHIMLDWMRIRNKGIKIDAFFRNKNYFDVAIYGMGHIGECLYNELYESDINIKYGIDRTAMDFRKELPIFKIEDDLTDVDIVIATMAEIDESLIAILKGKLSCPVTTISEILIELDNEIV